MPPRVHLKRLAYRVAATLLRVYWFLARPHVSGVKCVLTDGDHVLLVRHTYGPRTWDVPGGGLKRGEAPAEAVRREMAEELGVTIDDWSELGEVTGDHHFRHDTMHCFHAELAPQPLTLDLGELATARWFPRDRFPAGLGYYTRDVVALLPPVTTG
jgi:8-oxo-dGTP pyrophosphatase MutT (NUDIX family)